MRKKSPGSTKMAVPIQRNSAKQALVSQKWGKISGWEIKGNTGNQKKKSLRKKTEVPVGPGESSLSLELSGKKWEKSYKTIGTYLHSPVI